MLRVAPLLMLLLLTSCKETECIDCQDNAGNIFTFCDPPEPILDSLDCGDVYTTRK